MKETKQAKGTPKQTPPPQPQEEAFDWSGEQTTGFEATRPEDMGIPFLSLLQKSSPEVDEDHPEHEAKGIEGAKAGMVLNTVSRELVYDRTGEGIIFVPAFHEKLYQEWKPRNSGGGFVQSHRSAVILQKTSRNEKNEDVLPNGNIIITTCYFYGFAFLNESWTRVVLPMSSTQLKKARGWLNLMHEKKLNGTLLPMYSHAYSLTTVAESNEKGNWWGWKIDTARMLTKADANLITEARSIAKDYQKNTLMLPAAVDVESETGDSMAESEARQRHNR